MCIKINYQWLEVECESINFRKQIQSHNHNDSIQIVSNTNIYLIKQMYAYRFIEMIHSILENCFLT